MSFQYSGPSSEEVNQVLNTLIDTFVHRLGENLKGLYLHGSMAMGCFHPWSSDIDLLAVVFEPIDRQTKLALVGGVMAAAEGGCPFRKVEFSVVTADAALRVEHPIPYILHYSDSWHQRYRQGDAEPVIAGGTDEDLAAHFMVTRQRGFVLAGAPIDGTIGDISREDYLKAVWYDIRGAKEEVANNPAYVVLNLCRTLMYLRTGCIGSKLEGGQWGLEQPELSQYAWLIREAVGAYTHGLPAPSDLNALDRFTVDLLGRIRLQLPFSV